MKIAINDASILIDLSTINLLKPFLKLPFEMMTTDFIIMEIKNPKILEEIRAYIKHKQFTVISSTLEEMEAQLIPSNSSIFIIKCFINNDISLYQRVWLIC